MSTSAPLNRPSQTSLVLKKPRPPLVNARGRPKSQSTHQIVTSLTFDRSKASIQVIYDSTRIRFKHDNQFGHIELTNNSDIPHLIALFPSDWKLTNKDQPQSSLQRTTTLSTPQPAHLQPTLQRRASLPTPAPTSSPAHATQPLARSVFASRAPGACPIPEEMAALLPGLASQPSQEEPATQDDEVAEGQGAAGAEVDRAGLTGEEFEKVVREVLGEDGFVELVERVKSTLGL